MQHWIFFFFFKLLPTETAGSNYSVSDTRWIFFFTELGSTICILCSPNMSTVIIKVRHYWSHLAPVIYSHKTGTIVLAARVFQTGTSVGTAAGRSQHPGFNEFSSVCVCCWGKRGEEITLLESSQICAATVQGSNIYIYSFLAQQLPLRYPWARHFNLHWKT